MGKVFAWERKKVDEQRETGEEESQTYRTREVQQAKTVVVRLVSWRAYDPMDSTLYESSANEGKNLGSLHVEGFSRV
jgi:hypothetical protein